MCRSRRRSESGLSGILILGMVPAFIMMAGLVFDGGNALAAKRRAADEANSAARAGAMALANSDIRSGGLGLDAPATVAAAQGYLAAAGHPGTVHISGDVVTVTVTVHYSGSLLPISWDLVGTGHARPVRGVTRGENGP